MGEMSDDTHEAPPCLAPNGERSNLDPELWKFVRTPEFKSQFGDWEHDPTNSSIAIDKNGEPREFFFGGAPHITKMNRDRPRNTGPHQKGFYVSPKRNYAKFFGNKFAVEEREEGRPGVGSLYSCFLNARSVMVIEKDSVFTPSSINEWPEGYDCIIDNRGGHEIEVVVRNAEQVLIARETVINRDSKEI